MHFGRVASRCLGPRAAEACGQSETRAPPAQVVLARPACRPAVPGFVPIGHATEDLDQSTGSADLCPSRRQRSASPAAPGHEVAALPDVLYAHDADEVPDGWGKAKGIWPKAMGRFGTVPHETTTYDDLGRGSRA